MSSALSSSPSRIYLLSFDSRLYVGWPYEISTLFPVIALLSILPSNTQMLTLNNLVACELDTQGHLAKVPSVLAFCR